MIVVMMMMMMMMMVMIVMATSTAAHRYNHTCVCVLGGECVCVCAKREYFASTPPQLRVAIYIMWVSVCVCDLDDASQNAVWSHFEADLKLSGVVYCPSVSCG